MEAATSSDARASANATGLQSLVEWLENHAVLIVALMMVGYTIVFTAASIYKYRAYAMGFDLALYEQEIWNTAHGRWFETSVFSFTNNALGADLQLIEAPLAIIYAVAPSVNTLLFVQSAALALGALPLFLLARDRLGWSLAGLAFALAYLLYPIVTNTNLYEFRLRSFAVAPFLFALYFLFKQQLFAYYISLFIALLCRTDMGLLVAMVGLYALWQHKSMSYWLVPLVVGVAWVALGVFVVVPRFSSGHAYLFTSIYYNLGASPSEIAQTFVTRPFYVLQQLLLPEKLAYLWALLAPLAFMSLLNLPALLIAAPVLVLNLLSPTSLYWDIFHGYSIAIVPFVFLAAVEGIRWLSARRQLPQLQSRNGLTVLLGIVLGATVLTNLAWGNPALRWVLGRRDSTRPAIVREFAAMVPPDAPLAAGSLVAPQLPPRRQLYYFPGNQSYDPSNVDKADYILADLKGASDDTDKVVEAYRKNPAWQVVAERDEMILLMRKK